MILSNFSNLSWSCSEGFDSDSEDSTTLKVHFKDLTCIKYRRDMYMTWDGLFGNKQNIYSLHGLIESNWMCHPYHSSTASFGGIFGLCLGGSVISLVELLYYFTIKLYNKITNRRYDEKRKRMEKAVAVHKHHHQHRQQEHHIKHEQHVRSHQPPVKQISVEPTNYYPTKPSIDLSHGENNKMPQLKLNTNRMGGYLGKTAYYDYNRPNMFVRWTGEFAGIIVLLLLLLLLCLCDVCVCGVWE